MGDPALFDPVVLKGEVDAQTQWVEHQGSVQVGLVFTNVWQGKLNWRYQDNALIQPS